MLDLALVGTGGLMPLPNRWLASVLVRYGPHLVLFDCGEGTQISLRALSWGIKDIDLILISHVHGDHIAGLPGLLLTLSNSGRTEPVHLVGPPGVRRVVDGLRVVAPHLAFEVRCEEWHSTDRIQIDALQVTCGEGDHHVPCLAYRLDLPRAPQFQPDRARALGVPIQHWNRLQHGEVVDDVHPDAVLGPPRRGLAVALVTDTRPTSTIAQLCQDVDLLVCEANFATDNEQPRAVERKHMTFREAAELAKRAHVKQLVLSHYSPAIVDPEAYADNARAVFAATTVGRDHLTLSLRFPED
jgi:ribonuclease Z